MFRRKPPTENDLKVKAAYEEALLESRIEEAKKVAKFHAQQEAELKMQKASGGGIHGALKSFDSARRKFITHMDTMPDLLEPSYFKDPGGMNHGKEKKAKKEEMI